MQIAYNSIYITYILCIYIYSLGNMGFSVNTVTQRGKTRESEKDTERYLVRQVVAHGGLCLKYTSHIATGYPDRLCVVPPEGRAFWVELKSEGKRPRALQLVRFAELRRIGSKVYVCDTRKAVDDMLISEGL